jgi:hypothetical protein
MEINKRQITFDSYRRVEKTTRLSYDGSTYLRNKDSEKTGMFCKSLIRRS